MTVGTATADNTDWSVHVRPRSQRGLLVSPPLSTPHHAPTSLTDNLVFGDDPPTRPPVALADVPLSAASRRRREHEDRLPDRVFNGRPPVSGSPIPALAHSRAGACQPRTPTPLCSCVSILRPPLTRPLIGPRPRATADGRLRRPRRLEWARGRPQRPCRRAGGREGGSPGARPRVQRLSRVLLRGHLWLLGYLR